MPLRCWNFGKRKCKIYDYLLSRAINPEDGRPRKKINFNTSLGNFGEYAKCQLHFLPPPPPHHQQVINVDFFFFGYHPLSRRDHFGWMHTIAAHSYSLAMLTCDWFLFIGDHNMYSFPLLFLQKTHTHCLTRTITIGGKI